MAKKQLTPEQEQIKAIKKEFASNSRTSALAIILALALVVSIFTVGKDISEKRENNANNDSYVSGDVVDNSNNSNKENTTTNSQNNVQDTQKDENNQNENNAQPDKNNDVLSDNPADWSKEQVTEFYKKAAAKSHNGAVSSQTMSMPKLIVNDGSGAMNTFVNFAKPVINKVLEKNTTTFDGITGGHDKLVASDIEKYRAYKEGDYTIIELKMVEQTDGVYGEPTEGTVGHAISVLGNVATAAAEFPDFDIKFEEADIKIVYANPIVRVRINKNGVIEKGTWSYKSKVYIRHLQINTLMVDKADAEIDYAITVGGGF